MKRIKDIEGKTIKKAQVGGGDIQEGDNRTMQLDFTDGSTFCINIECRLSGSYVIYEDAKDDEGKETKI